MDTVVNRFILEKRPFYFRSEWSSKQFELSITDGKHVWQGKADATYIEQKLKPQGMDFAEYMKLMRSGLTKQDVQQKKYAYAITQLEESPNDIELIWKMRIADESEEDEALDIFVKGSLTLKRVMNGQVILQRFLDWLIDKATTLEKDNKELRNKNDDLQKQRDDGIQKLTLFVNDKKAMEGELYHKFVLVLNEKKKKIRELKQESSSYFISILKFAVQELEEEGYRKPKPEPRASNVKFEHKHEEEEEEEDENVSQYLNQSQSLSQGRSPTPSLTFNMDFAITPSTDLLSMDSAYVIKPSVRKRHRTMSNMEPPENPTKSTSNTLNTTTNKSPMNSSQNVPQASSEASKAKPVTLNPPPSTSNNNPALKSSLKPSMDPQTTSSSLSKSNNNPSLQNPSIAVKKDAVAAVKNIKEIPVSSPANKRQPHPAQPFKPPQQLLQSPQVKSKISHADGVRSPGMVTPSPSMTPMKKVAKKRKASGSEGLEAEDLFELMSE